MPNADEGIALHPSHAEISNLRKGFIPRVPADFGDGGAFPEIPVAQYPMDMGRPDPRGSGAGSKKSNALAVQLDAEGKVKYDLIARQVRKCVRTH